MADTVVNIQENIYSDKFDIDLVSSLSLFLFDEKYILLGKDVNDQISGIHQKFFSDLNSLNFVLERDKLFGLDIPTKIFLFHKSFALIPGVVFEASSLETYLNFSDQNDLPATYLYSNIDSNNLYIASKIDNSLKAIFEKKKSNITCHHGSSSFLSYAFGCQKSFLNQEILISVFGHNFYVAAFKNQNLDTFNVFECEDRDSFMNYLYGVSNHLDYDRKHCRVTVMGEFEQLEIDQDFGEKFYKNFKLTQPEPNQRYQDGAEIFKKSKFFEGFWEFK